MKFKNGLKSSMVKLKSILPSEGIYWGGNWILRKKDMIYYFNHQNLLEELEAIYSYFTKYQSDYNQITFYIMYNRAKPTMIVV